MSLIAQMASKADWTGHVVGAGQTIADNAGTGPDGTANFIRLTLTTTNVVYSYKTFTAITSTDFVIAFSVRDLFDFTMNNDTAHRIIYLRNAGGTRAHLEMHWISSAMKLRFTVLDDSSGSQATAEHTVTTATTLIQLLLHKGTGTSAYHELWFDETLKEQKTGYAHSTNFNFTEVRYGAFDNIDAGSADSTDYNRFIIRDDATLPGLPNDAPVVSVPADTTGTYGTTKNITTVSFTDNNSNVNEANISSPNVDLDITVVASGSAIVTGNGTNSVNITGTNAEVLATLASIDFDLADPGITVWDTDVVVTVEVIDSVAASDSDTFTITFTPANGLNTSSYIWEDTAANILASIQAGVEITPATDSTNTITGNLYGGINTNPVQSDAKQFTVAVTDIVNTAPRLTLPGTQTGHVDTEQAIPTILLEDDEDNASVLTLVASDGTMTVTVGGATITDGTNGSASITFSGTTAQLAAILTTILYTPATEGTNTITATVIDESGAVAQESLTISVSAVTPEVSQAGFFLLFD